MIGEQLITKILAGKMQANKYPLLILFLISLIRSVTGNIFVQ